MYPVQYSMQSSFFIVQGFVKWWKKFGAQFFVGFALKRSMRVCKEVFRNQFTTRIVLSAKIVNS